MPWIFSDAAESQLAPGQSLKRLEGDLAKPLLNGHVLSAKRLFDKFVGVMHRKEVLRQKRLWKREDINNSTSYCALGMQNSGGNHDFVPCFNSGSCSAVRIKKVCFTLYDVGMNLI